MKHLVFVAFAIAACVCSAEGKEDIAKLTPAERKARHERLVMENHGGFVTQKGTPAGSIVVINSQKKVAADAFSIGDSKALRRLESVVKIIDGEAATVATVADLKKKYKADFALFVVEDPALPISLVAVEAQWAIMNITPLTVGAVSDKNVAIRVKNEYARVFALLCGGMASQFKAPLTNDIKTVRDLDFCSDELPVDVSARLVGYLDQRGVRPEKKVFYRKACEEGWAAQPTNDFQRVIWEEYHSKPTEPMKIKFDPKKGI